MKAIHFAVPLLAITVSASLSQAVKPEQKVKTASAKRLFASNCAACHGIDGKGSERAPNIVEGISIRNTWRSRIFAIIQNGIPGRGMPAFHTLTATQIDALIVHLQALGGTSRPEQLPGNPFVGKPIFSGKGGCSGCHMLSGNGGFIASDLSDYVRAHSAEQVRNVILNPSASPDGSLRIATVKLLNGETCMGRVRNEDNFSIQLQDLNGSFHLLPRSAVAAVDYDPKSMMPADYGSRLTPQELDDLVSYLVATSARSPTTRPRKLNAEDCSPDCTDPDE